MQQIIRISVSEAARLFGVDQKTIRRAIASGQVKYIVFKGRYKIHFASLLEWSQNRTASRNKLAQNGIGQYVDKWKINNRLYSPHPGLVAKPEEGTKK